MADSATRIAGLMAVLGNANRRNEDRRNAAWDMARLGEEGIDTLLSALHDEQPSIRAAAAYGLIEIKEARLFAPLLAALTDADVDVRTHAAWALGHLGNREAIHPLITALDDEFSDVRCAAADALSLVGDEQALPVLETLRREHGCEITWCETSWGGDAAEAIDRAIERIRIRQGREGRAC